jgi:ATP-binding protein involved in chromosome partitioning
MTQQNIPQARAKIESMKRQFEQKRQIDESLAGIKHKIGVYSGKGGVGKTTVAVNLAATLANDGHTVGILDVDIDCPNVIRAMNISEQPLLDENKKMIPAERFGVKVMSMAYFQENEDEATIWRGPMIHNAINQMLQSTNWGNLEYLIIDMPPGTSDAPLTVMQVLSMDGFVVVTTPQELAKIDAKRSINMIKKLKVNVLGVVENMSGGIFGTGAGNSN